MLTMILQDEQWYRYLFDRDNQENKKKRKLQPENYCNQQETTHTSTKSRNDNDVVVKRMCVSPNTLENKVYLNMYSDQYLIGVKGYENAMILRKMAEKMNKLEDLNKCIGTNKAAMSIGMQIKIIFEKKWRKNFLF